MHHQSPCWQILVPQPWAELTENPTREKEFEWIEDFQSRVNKDETLTINHFKYLKFSYIVPQSVIHPYLGQNKKNLFQPDGFQLDTRKVALATRW